MLTIFVALLTGIVCGWLLKGMFKIGVLTLAICGVAYFGARYVNVNWSVMGDDVARAAEAHKHFSPVVEGAREQARAARRRWM